MLPPKASTGLSVAEALFVLSGRSVVGGGYEAGERICAAARNSLFENGIDRKGAPSPNELSKRSLAENTKAMRRWSAGGGLSARRSRPLVRRTLVSPKALFWTLPMR